MTAAPGVAGAPDASPQTLQELLALLQSQARGRWGVWHAELEGRSLYYGRRLYHLNGYPCDKRMKMPLSKVECCLRCGNGTTFRWPPEEPQAFTALRWATLCFKCLGVYVAIWPEVFPRLRMGVRTAMGQDNRFWHERTFSVGRDWYRRPPFGIDSPISNPWMHSSVR